MRLRRRAGLVCALTTWMVTDGAAQSALTWAEIRTRFLETNPSVRAGETAIDESKAGEIAAYVRPNPQWSLTWDQIGNTEGGNIFSASTLGMTVSYLHERQHKRELRRDSARGATALAVSSQADLERNLIFTLRGAFIQILKAKAFRALARDNLASYDEVLALSQDRFRLGDIAQIDLNRLQLQRVQYESDVQTAEVSLGTAKVQLLRLLNDQATPIEQLDVTGPFDFGAPTQSLDEFRRMAFDARPDFKAALEAVEKAKIDHRLAIANGSTDPTINVDAGFPSISQVFLSYQPPLRQFVGFGAGMPLRIFDRNQGEKLRTELDITRSGQLAHAARLQVFADVDTAYATVMSTVALLQPYKDRYLDEATRVHDTIAFSYQRGGVSLIDFLQSQQEYRTVHVSYVNLVAAFLNAVNQLNLAVGREVIP